MASNCTTVDMLRSSHPTTSSVVSESLQQQQPSWPFKRVAEIPGDIVIGGLHMVHEREDQKVCGPVMIGNTITATFL